MEKEKLGQSVDLLKEFGVDVWITMDEESGLFSDPVMDYIVGSGVTWFSFFIISASGRKYAIVGNLDRERIERLGLFDEIYTYKNSPRDDLLAILKKESPSKIAINFSENSPSADGLTHGKYLKFKKFLEGTGFEESLISSEKIIGALRGRKSPVEVSRMERAAKITVDIYDKVTEFVRPGMTEKEVASFITQEREKLGLEPSWEAESNPSVFTGPQETGAHSGPTGKKVERGHVFNIDSGVIYEKYCSDLQRTWYVLKEGETEPPEEVMHGFNTIVESIKLSFNSLRPGAKGIDIDTIAREYIISQGYEEYPHALGHQVGRSAHDGGALLGPAWDRYGDLPYIPLEEHQVFTIEPRLYLKDHGVITIEEMVEITPDGARWMSEPQTEIFLIK